MMNRRPFSVRDRRDSLRTRRAGKTRRQATLTPAEQRERQRKIVARKESEIALALKSQSGIYKLAANLGSPVKKQLDYEAVSRRFCVVESIPDGAEATFDNDIEPWNGVKIGIDGTSRAILCEALRTRCECFEMTSRAMMAYRELYTRKYKVLVRARERLLEGLKAREDLLFFSLLATAAAASGQTATVGASALTQAGLARAFALVENNRLPTKYVLMEPYATMGIRRWEFSTLDQAGMQAIRETGYLGSIWNTDFIQSDLVTDGKVYILTDAPYLAWMPIRQDADVQPADERKNLVLGFVGYEFIDQLIHNNTGVAELTFDVSQ